MTTTAKISRAAFAAAVAGILTVLVSCGPNVEAAKPQTPAKVVPVGVLEVKAAEFSEYGVYYGKLMGREEASLVTTLGGRVEKITAREGDRVSVGTSLAAINAAKAQSLYDLAALNERVARSTFERQQQFLKEGNVSKLSVDQSELAWLQAKDSFIDAKLSLEGALAVTPIDGVVVRRFVDLHQELSPGAPTFTVARMDQIKVKIGIPEQEIDGIREGNPAEITLSSAPGRVWPGKLSRLGRKVDASTLTFDAEVMIDNPDGALLPGTTAAVRLLRRNLEGRVVIPNEALLTSGQETYVMIEEDKVARKVNVIPGPSNKTHTVILKGLNPGLRIIVSGNHLVSDGTAVAVQENG